MKSLNEFKTLMEEEKSDYSKFDMLVRAGLANKAQLQRIHRILDKMQEEKPVFNNADREILRNLFNRMADMISNNKQIFQQARRAVREDVESVPVEIEEALTLPNDPPMVLLLKRVAVRFYPNKSKVALYYNQKLDKHFTIPYGQGIEPGGMQAEEVELDEEVEQIDEISKKTLGSYVKKATSSAQVASVGVDRELRNIAVGDPMSPGSDKKLNKYQSQLTKRKSGISKAVDRLAKEEVEQIDEIHSPGTKVRIPHKGKMVTGKVVRHDKGSMGESPAYVVYVGEYESAKVPAHKVQKVTEEVEPINEAIDTLRKIVRDRQHGVVKHKDGTRSKVDGYTASAIMSIHDNLNDENKRKLEDMVHGSHAGLAKVAGFAFSKAKK